MVTYGRIGGKIVPSAPKFGTYPTISIDPDTCIRLEGEIDGWVQSALLNHPSSSKTPIDEFRFKTFLRVRSNQMRLSLYKHTLYSPQKISDMQHFAQVAVSCAKDTLSTVEGMKRAEVSGEEDVQYSFFVISSMAVLYLALQNGFNRFSGVSDEYWMGLKLLKSLFLGSGVCDKRRKQVEALETAITRLGVHEKMQILPVGGIPYPLSFGNFSPYSIEEYSDRRLSDTFESCSPNQFAAPSYEPMDFAQLEEEFSNMNACFPSEIINTFSFATVS